MCEVTVLFSLSASNPKQSCCRRVLNELNLDIIKLEKKKKEDFWMRR